MPSSSFGKSVMKKEVADNMALDFTPRALDAKIPEVAKEFLSENQKRPTSFRLSELVAKQTGITEIERRTLQDKIEAKALERVKEIQEASYREAYALGLEEGRAKAFEAEQGHILDRLNQFDTLLSSLNDIKTELIAQNESHVIRLVMELAKKLYSEQIAEKPEHILPVLRQAIEVAQSEENVLVRLSDDDFKFIEGMKGKVSKEFEFLRRVKFESSPDIQSGGCVVETNYGVIDSTIEERVGKLWSILQEKIPKVRASIKS